MARAHTPRMTGTTRQVLACLLESPTGAYGLEIGTATGLASGTVHPILARLEGLGWVSSEWEDVDASAVGRPRRRYYRLTGHGARSATTALATAEAAVRRRQSRGLRTAFQGGLS